jgi:RNA-binding protein
MINSKQRAKLKAIAQDIDAIFQIGKGGISENMATQIGDALTAREIVKISLLDNSDGEVRAVGAEIAELTGSELVQTIGRKIILYRENSKKPKISEEINAIGKKTAKK